MMVVVGAGGSAGAGYVGGCFATACGASCNGLEILFRVFTRYQPGKLAERSQLLRGFRGSVELRKVACPDP